MMDSIIEFDTWLLLTINGFNHEYIDPMMRAFSSKGIWIALYATIAGVIWWRFGWHRALLLVVAAGIAVGLSDLICASAIRPLVQRLRPTHPDNEISALVHIVNGYRSTRYGFPSCHAANTMALALFTSLIMRSQGYTIFIFLWALMQCYSRAYLGVHYPGDLLVGTLVGLSVSYLIYRLSSHIIDLKYDLNPKSKTWPVWAVGLALCIFIVVRSLVMQYNA